MCPAVPSVTAIHVVYRIMPSRHALSSNRFRDYTFSCGVTSVVSRVKLCLKSYTSSPYCCSIAGYASDPTSRPVLLFQLLSSNILRPLIRYSRVSLRLMQAVICQRGDGTHGSTAVWSQIVTAHSIADIRGKTKFRGQVGSPQPNFMPSGYHCINIA